MKKQLFAALCAFAAIPAFAEGYAGVSVGRAEQKLDVETISLSESKTGAKVYGGYNFTPTVGAEFGYVSFGKATFSGGGATVSTKPKSVYAAVTGTAPLSEAFSAHAKVGLARTRTDITASFAGETESAREHDTRAMLGLGASYALSPTASVVAEYEYFGKVAKDEGVSLKADLLSVGVRFKF